MRLCCTARKNLNWGTLGHRNERWMKSWGRLVLTNTILLRYAIVSTVLLWRLINSGLMDNTWMYVQARRVYWMLMRWMEACDMCWWVINITDWSTWDETLHAGWFWCSNLWSQGCLWSWKYKIRWLSNW